MKTAGNTQKVELAGSLFDRPSVLKETESHEAVESFKVESI